MASRRIVVPVGTVFGRLSVILELPVRRSRRGGTKRWFLCCCDCGVERSVRLGNLRSCHTQSCGRHLVPPSNAGSYVKRSDYHGKSDTPEYGVWKGMTKRCYHPSCKEYVHYGGRGIRMCGGWRSCFRAFWEDMGPRPSAAHSIDRIDNGGHYSCGHCAECIENGWPFNCRWATTGEQRRNRNDVRMLTFGGRTMCLSDWAAYKGMTKSALSARLKKMSVTDALRLPVRQWRSDASFLSVPESDRDWDWHRDAARRRSREC